MGRGGRKGQSHRAKPRGLMSQAGVVHPVIVHRPVSSAGDVAGGLDLTTGVPATGAVLGPGHLPAGPRDRGGSV